MKIIFGFMLRRTSLMYRREVCEEFTRQNVKPPKNQAVGKHIVERIAALSTHFTSDLLRSSCLAKFSGMFLALTQLALRKCFAAVRQFDVQSSIDRLMTTTPSDSGSLSVKLAGPRPADRT